jgi:hypothetical protein
MAATTATIGYGATVSYSDTENGSYTPIAEILDLALPELTQDSVDATHMESPDNYMEKIPALKDPGEYTFSFNFNNDQYETVFGMVGTAKWWMIQSPGGDAWIFPGFISGLGGEMPVNDRIVAEVTLTVSGAIDFEKNGT